MLADRAPYTWGDSNEVKAEESSTVLEHKQDVFICAVAAPRILKILETGAAHPWKPPKHIIIDIFHPKFCEIDATKWAKSL